MKTRVRRMLALCMSMVLLTACSTVTPTPKPTPTPPPSVGEVSTAATPFTLAYSRADSLDPYQMSSRVNRELCGLLYEGLTVMDSTMHAVPALAARVEVQGLTVTATLREDAVFSDGTAVTTADVLASFAAAKDCAAYEALLSNVKDASADDDGGGITFSLQEGDPYAAACLTFPVIRTGEDGTVLGSGPYVFDNTPRLVANTHGGESAFSEIRLLDLVDDEERAGGVELGNLTYFYSDLSSGDIPRVSGATSAVSGEYLIFLGITSSKKALRSPDLRQALSLSIDRQRAADSAFAGYAEPALTPFPVPFAKEMALTSLSATADRTAAGDLLSAAGYTVPGREAEKTETLSLTLLVNEENGFKTALAALLKEQLEAVGVAVTTVSLPFDDYKVALRNNRCDLYIGEIRLAANMDLSPLFEKGGTASYGLARGSDSAKHYAAFREGSVSVTDFAATFAAELPFIPVCWRGGLAAYNRTLTNVTPTAFNVYADLKNWKLTN